MKTNGQIRRWITLGYSVPVVVAVISSLSIWSHTRSLRNTIDSLSSYRSNLERIDAIALNAQISSRTTRGYLLDKNQVSLDSYKVAEDKLEELRQELEISLIDPEQQEIFSTLNQSLDKLSLLNNELIALVNAGQSEKAIQRWKTDDGRELAENTSALFDQFRQRQIKLVEEVELHQNNSLTALVWVALGSAVALIGSGLFMAWFITQFIAKQLNRASSSIVSSSSQIAATVAEQERATAQQAASVNETTTTMDELNASARQVMEQAEAATMSAREALQESESGTQAVELTMESMILLKDKVGAIAQQILRLSEQTNQIGNISTLVSDLANQTNMLALNAAVEAVRAGEHGRGFSVVASEIRKLADRSKQSAAQIGNLVADIQTAINSTVMVTDEGTKTVESGVIRSQETSNSLAGIRGAVDRVVLNNQQISLTIKQQVTAIQQVVEAMNSLNSAAQESASGIGQVKTGTQLLNEAAENLSTLV
ncbi:MAG: methyl-accepting chemotaxis protein [Oscillatoriales cyanobacterium]|nr:MAG: methyl-accepting chemotaxis protein [Oscillatoriales cyanobacterium]